MKRILLKLFFWVTLLFSCGTSTHHRVPIADNITIDGFFEKEEWKEAKMIQFTASNTLYLMQSTDYIFLGIQNNGNTRRYVDLYISSASRGMLNLHASMQLGERKLIDNWNDTIPSWNWGNNQGWTSNRVEILNHDDNISFTERLKPYQGHEFQISKEKIGRKQFKIRLEIKDFIGQANDVIFPINSDKNRTENWFIVKVN